MKMEYDPEAGAAYVRLSAKPVAKTEEVAPGVILDLDADGLPVGVELLDAGGDESPRVEIVLPPRRAHAA
ncbi:MAG: DUF2283 domain-containing protein [Chloroflexota bacterium]|nr:DUF2283 domain-containing protein [Chloroflexota bacterium]